MLHFIFGHNFCFSERLLEMLQQTCRVWNVATNVQILECCNKCAEFGMLQQMCRFWNVATKVQSFILCSSYLLACQLEQDGREVFGDCLLQLQNEKNNI